MDSFNHERPASGTYPAQIGKVSGQDGHEKVQNAALSCISLDSGDVWQAEDIAFTDADLLLLETRGTFSGSITVSHDAKGRNVIGEYEVDSRNDYWELHLVPFVPDAGRHPLCVRFDGRGTMELRTVGFISA